MEFDNRYATNGKGNLGVTLGPSAQVSAYFREVLTDLQVW